MTAPTLLLGKRDMSEAPPIRSFGRDFSNFWFWVETGKKVSDLQSGFRAYPAKELLEAGCFWPRYEFMGEVLARFAWKGWAIESVDVKCYYPPAEERITHFRMVADNIRFVYMNTHMVTLRILNLLFRTQRKRRFPGDPHLRQSDHVGLSFFRVYLSDIRSGSRL